jgi:hypothetical protein
MRPLRIDRHAARRHIFGKSTHRVHHDDFAAGFGAGSSEALRDAGATNSTQAVTVSPSPGFSLTLGS